MNPVRVRRVQGKYQWWKEAKAADAVSSGASSMMQDRVEENSASPENSSEDEGCWPSTEASSLKDDSELEELEGCEPDVNLASAFKTQDDVIRFAEPLTHTVPDRADTGHMVVDDIERNASPPDQPPYSEGGTSGFSRTTEHFGGHSTRLMSRATVCQRLRANKAKSDDPVRKLLEEDLWEIAQAAPGRTADASFLI
jgi:hypothetical protein